MVTERISVQAKLWTSQLSRQAFRRSCSFNSGEKVETFVAGRENIMICGPPWTSSASHPGHMWTAPWQALSSATSLWRVRSYVRPVGASRNPLAMMISASSGFSSAPRARGAGRGTECPGRRFAGSPSPHCALAKLRRRLRRDALINRWTAPRAGTVRRSS